MDTFWLIWKLFVWALVFGHITAMCIKSCRNGRKAYTGTYTAVYVIMLLLLAVPFTV